MVERTLLGALLAAGLVHAAAACAAELEPLDSFRWRGETEEFGGFSGLVMAPDGSSFYAVSDKGVLFHAGVDRDAIGRIASIETDWHGRLLANRGGEVHGFTADAEGLAPARDGGLFVVYESYARVNQIHPPDLLPRPLHSFDRFRDYWSNESFESVAEMPDGGLIIVGEKADAVSDIYATAIGRGTTWQPAAALPAGSGGFDATDATFGPDGRFYLLERRLGAGGFSTRIRRFAYEAGAFAAPETLLETPPGLLDNMEGISLWTDSNGRTVISLISDDNFFFAQKTILAEYELRERP
jgi:hypothetical protein